MATDFNILFEQVLLEKKDRCYRRAKSKFKVFPSYNAASAIARCRKGKIWKKRK